jgi:hypothetical protein
MNSTTCPPNTFRDDWVRYPHFDAINQTYLVPECDSSLVGFWLIAIIFVQVRLIFCILNAFVIRHKLRQGKKRIPTTFILDFIHTLIIIILISQFPTSSSSKDGITVFIFGIALVPCYVSSLLFNFKLVHQSRRQTLYGGITSSSRRIGGDPMLIVLFSLLILSIVGFVVSWTIGAYFGIYNYYYYSIVQISWIAGFSCLTIATASDYGIIIYEIARTILLLRKHSKMVQQLQPSPKDIIIHNNKYKSLNQRLFQTLLISIVLCVVATSTLIAVTTTVLDLRYPLLFFILSVSLFKSITFLVVFWGSSNNGSDDLCWW